MDINKQEYTILIVDDVDANVLLLKLLISKAGYKTLLANNGKEALDIIVEKNPDLILLDIMMPIMDGHEVIRKLKEMPDKKDIPVIFLSALNYTEDIVQGYKLGASDYVSKPFNKDELLTRIDNQISLIHAKRTIAGRDKLYSILAHDLRSPIASIRSVLETIVTCIDKESVDENIVNLLIMAKGLIDDSFTLLDDLLKWTKSQTGLLTPFFQENIAIQQIITHVVDSFTSSAQLKNIELKVIGSTNRMARLDIEMAKTALRNLLSNAIKFSYSNSVVEIVIREEEQRVVVEIRDNGIGINSEKQELLLSTEAVFNNSINTKENGSGLGLILCNEFIKRNGGTLKYSSREGVGSTFSFDIPTKE